MSSSHAWYAAMFARMDTSPPYSARDEWTNPSVEEWASVAGRAPVAVERRWAFTVADDQAEKAALDRLAELSAANDPWTAARLAFTQDQEDAR